MMKISTLAIALLCVVDLSGCSTNFAPPPVTSEMARRKSGQHVDLATLRDGRALFVSRCIECHTLPAISRYHIQEWPCLVDIMAPRAKLGPAERDAVVAYIRSAYPN